MLKDKFGLLILMSALAIVVSGCSVSFKSGEGGIDGGLYASNSRGDTWVQRSLIPTVNGQPQNFANFNAAALAADPSDPNAFYYGSVDNGLLYTYTGAREWFSAGTFPKATINAIAVDPSAKCIVYAASQNKLYKTIDCSRTWAQVYYDDDLKTLVNSVAIDPYNPANVYIGTSRGEVIKSSDKGTSWKTSGRLENNVKKVIINPADSRIILAATLKKGVSRSIDGGANWVSQEEKLKDFSDGFNFKDIIFAPADKNLVFLATKYGLLKSTDNGDNWTKMELITPEEKATINALAVNPKNSKEIYYVTNTTFYRSLDGGSNWTTKKLPTTRAGWSLVVNRENPNILYLGVRKVEDSQNLQ